MTGKDSLSQRSYEDKKMSLEEALGLIETGDHIFIGSACGEPQYLVNGPYSFWVGSPKSDAIFSLTEEK